MNSNRVELNRVMTWEVNYHQVIDENPIFLHRAEECRFVGGGGDKERPKNKNLPLEYGEYV